MANKTRKKSMLWGDLDADSVAVFSGCERYRFTLRRRWAAGLLMNWVMLNPSTADETKNDPTVERCCRRAYRSGYGGVIITNIFSLRSTDPKAIYEESDPVGAGNDEAIVASAKECGLVVCGWGNHGNHLGRGQHVLSSLLAADVQPLSLKMTASHQPGHPLYISYKIEPKPIQAAA